MSMVDYLYYTFVRSIRQVRMLYYLPYNEEEVLDKLTREVGWQSYGGKHHESKYTGFFKSFILTRKFNIDKRKLHYSALLRNDQMTREEALAKVKNDPYDGGKETLDYCLKKLDYTHNEFEAIMNEKPKLFLDYESHYSLVRKMEKPIRWCTNVGIIPDTVYRKFFKFDI